LRGIRRTGRRTSAARRRYVELVGEYFEDEDFYEERVKAFLDGFF
jgi:hypothetical protein